MAPKKASAAPTRVSSRQSSNADKAKATKPVANTKAKVTKPAAKAKATATSKAAATKTAKVAASKTAKAAKDVKSTAKKPTAAATKAKTASTKAAATKPKTATAKATDTDTEAVAADTKKAATQAKSAATRAQNAATKSAAANPDSAATKAAINKAALLKTEATKATAAATKAKMAATKAAAKDAPKKPAASTKRKAADDAAPAPAKKAKVTEKKPAASRKRKAVEEPTAPPAKKVKVVPKGPIINAVPTHRLNVYVCGDNDLGELGLGTKQKHREVKRPRLNHNLLPDKVGVVQVDAGGQHGLALTHDNKIFSWGVNDHGTLARDTTWDGGLKDIDAEDSESEIDGKPNPEKDTGLDPHETLPAAIPSDKFPADTVFVQVIAGDSCSFALTDDGQVWGWGTFRNNNGIYGFTPDVFIATEPVLIPGLKKITKLACGENHVLALDVNGQVYAWGASEQCQLGRRGIERQGRGTLEPRTFGLPRNAIKDIACGDNHSFAIDNKDRVWAWGLNSTGQTGIVESVEAAAKAGDGDSVVLKPTVIESLVGKKITTIKGGASHTIAVTDTGDCLTWGRTDNNALGIDVDDMPSDAIIKNVDTGKARVLTIPSKVPDIDGKVAFATAAGDHCIAITEDHRAFSWGYSFQYQTGQGTSDDVEEPTHIDNTALRGKKVNGATCGAQWTMITAIAEEAPETNGVNGTD